MLLLGECLRVSQYRPILDEGEDVTLGLEAMLDAARGAGDHAVRARLLRLEETLQVLFAVAVAAG